ncbi:hypothetical protein FEE96_16740 [Parasedimentitalea maritima]|uniref:Hedgehog/Intein (Hint) domain-containing protein n=2 Tax=Parasedimentitalea maritima TaxID=2578117 RepID=A0ABY2USW6_9RHOB|nr:hypothetical protein FEE96_16740 [Zongyanglinia marina]
MIPVKHQNHTSAEASPSAGLMRDTIVLTRQGDVAVQDIRAGDHVITRGAGMVQVHSITRQRAFQRAISIAAGSLGDTRPDCDIVLPADQKVLIRDWRAQALFGQDQALVAASSLVDGEFIIDQGMQVLELYTLELGQSHVIYAGGLEVAGAFEPVQDLRPAA